MQVRIVSYKLYNQYVITKYIKITDEIVKTCKSLIIDLVQPIHRVTSVIFCQGTIRSAVRSRRAVNVPFGSNRRASYSTWRRYTVKWAPNTTAGAPVVETKTATPVASGSPSVRRRRRPDPRRRTELRPRPNASCGRPARTGTSATLSPTLPRAPQIYAPPVSYTPS